MTAELLFYILIGIIVVEFLWDSYLDKLNAKHYNDGIPKELEGIFNDEEYRQSQKYKLTNYHFSQWHKRINFILILIFFLIGGFSWLDEWVRKIMENPMIISLIFIGILGIIGSLIEIPFSYYDTFVIEEKFGFNKSTKKLFWLDQIKSMLLSIVLGGGLLSLILWFYIKTNENFWWYAWILITAFTLFMTLFYSNIIVPLFNKQTPLEDGELKEAIKIFASQTGFTLDNIFVIDGSKRSTKANAYFTGFGPKKRVVLYDTLISDLNTEEIVAVLAHEIGHYKKKHVLIQMMISIVMTGFTLFLLSLFIKSPLLSNALGISIPSFHIGIIVFGILYSPISEITGLFMNVFSRKFEYQADAFASEFFNSEALIGGLKKLSKKSLSNLTPHPLYVFWHYSHPTLLQRIRQLHLSKFNLDQSSKL